MKFSYRGIAYEKELPVIEMEAGNYGGKYRGQSWHYRYPRHINQPSSGINRLSQAKNVLLSSTAQASSDRSSCAVPILVSLKNGGTGLSEAHLNNIRRNLERRLEVAKLKGDRALINMLKQGVKIPGAKIISI